MNGSPSVRRRDAEDEDAALGGDVAAVEEGHHTDEQRGDHDAAQRDDQQAASRAVTRLTPLPGHARTGRTVVPGDADDAVTAALGQPFEVLDETHLETSCFPSPPIRTSPGTLRALLRRLDAYTLWAFNPRRGR